MTLEKAIEVLNAVARTGSYQPNQTNAVELGIEALKRIYNNRVTLPGFNFIPLPGETEE